MPKIQSPFKPLVGGAADVPDDLLPVYERGCLYVRVPVAESEDGLWVTVVDVGLTPREEQILIEGREPFSYHEFAYEISRMPIPEGSLNPVWTGMSHVSGFRIISL